MTKAVASPIRVSCKAPPVKTDPAQLAEANTYLIKRAFNAYHLDKVPQSIVHMGSLSYKPLGWSALGKDYAIAQDFASVGYMILLDAAHKWDPGKNPIFAAYAMGYFKKWKLAMEISIRAPSYSQGDAQYIVAYCMRKSKDPNFSPAEFAKEKKMSLKKAEQIAGAAEAWGNSAKRPERQQLLYGVKTDEPEERTNTQDLEDIGWCSLSQFSEESTSSQQLTEKLVGAVSFLPEKEQDIVAVCFGVG
ncbi:MAG: hypothetical protein GY852_00240, partial [bacterium]|nr:hypothetical protein [bacterium]